MFLKHLRVLFGLLGTALGTFWGDPGRLGAKLQPLRVLFELLGAPLVSPCPYRRARRELELNSVHPLGST